MYDAEFKTGSHALFNGVIKPSSNLDKLTDAFLFLLRWCGLPIWLRLKIRYQEILSLWVLSSSIFAVDNFELIPIWDSHTIHPWTWLVGGLNIRDSRRFSLEAAKPQDLECQFSMRPRGVAANSFLTWEPFFHLCRNHLLYNLNCWLERPTRSLAFKSCNPWRQVFMMHGTHSFSGGKMHTLSIHKFLQFLDCIHAILESTLALSICKADFDLALPRLNGVALWQPVAPPAIDLSHQGSEWQLAHPSRVRAKLSPPSTLFVSSHI